MLLQHGENPALLGLGILDLQGLDLPDGLLVLLLDGRQQEEHRKILPEAGQKRIVLILLGDGQGLIQPIRRPHGLADGQIAQRQSHAHEVPRGQGNEPGIQLQGSLHAGNGALVGLM